MPVLRREERLPYDGTISGRTVDERHSERRIKGDNHPPHLCEGTHKAAKNPSPHSSEQKNSDKGENHGQL